MVGHLAASLDPQHLDAALSEGLRRCKNVTLVGLATEGQDSGVLEEEQLVLERAVGAGGREALLQRPGVAIRDPAQPRGANRWLRGRIALRHRRLEDRGCVHGRTIAVEPAAAVECPSGAERRCTMPPRDLARRGERGRKRAMGWSWPWDGRL